MKKYIKLICIVLSLVVLSGCVSFLTPSDKVDVLLKNYVKCESSIIKELNSHVDKKDLSDKEKEKYKDIIKREYSSIEYKIINETIDEDKARVEVSISVLDLFGASEKAESELVDNPMKFYTDGEYDKAKFIDYKLDIMSKTEDRKEYTIFINLTKDDNIWKLDTVDNDTLEKIHGIYDYTED